MCLVVLFVTVSADARTLEFDWYKKMEGLWNVNLGLHGYRPDENNINDYGLLIDGGVKYWPEDNWAVEFKVGYWGNDYTRDDGTKGDVEIHPFTLGGSYYFNEIFDRAKGYVGGSIGYYDVVIDPEVGSNSSSGEFGGNIFGGAEYFWADNFSADFRGTYHFASCEVANWDVELNGLQFGAYFAYYF